MLEKERLPESSIGYMTPENAEFQDRETAFGRQHRDDTDRQLLQYIRDRAAKLGHIPKKSEVPGYTYLKGRLGPWPRILEKAGLKKPRKKKTEKPMFSGPGHG